MSVPAASIATLCLPLGLLAAMPEAARAAVAATPAPCPTFAAGLVTFGIDQAQPVTVEQTQSFLLAMRGGGGESYLTPYRMRVAPAGPVVTYVRAFTISDVAFINADDANIAPSTPSPAASVTPQSGGRHVMHARAQIHAPVLADGATTQYFLFTASGVGTTTVVFDDFEIGKTTPYATKTYTIVVKPAVLIC